VTVLRGVLGDLKRRYQHPVYSSGFDQPVKFGRKRKLSDYQRKEAIKRRDAGETLASIAKSYAVDVSMISRLREDGLSPRVSEKQRPFDGAAAAA
jgi:hypothetical protein